jgi:hypothetical protein
LVPAAEPKIVGLFSPEVLVLVHAFSDKENTKAESSKNKDFCIRSIRRAFSAANASGGGRTHNLWIK